MAHDDAYYFQGLPPMALAQTLQTSHAENLASEAVLRARDEARSAKLLAAQEEARQAAWRASMAILDE